MVIGSYEDIAILVVSEHVLLCVASYITSIEIMKYLLISAIKVVLLFEIPGNSKP